LYPTTTRSIGSHSVLRAKVVVSKNRQPNTLIYTEETEEGFAVECYVIFSEQVNMLLDLGIDIKKTDSHHLVPQILKRCLKMILDENSSARKKKAEACAMEFNSDKNLRNKLNNIKDEIGFDYVIVLPRAVHGFYNIIFRECLSPKEVLCKIDLILDEYELSGDFRNCVINLFSFLAVLIKEISDIDAEKIKKLKNSDKCIKGQELLELFSLTKEEIMEFIARLFLHPEYEAISRHFEILTCIFKKSVKKNRGENI